MVEMSDLGCKGHYERYRGIKCIWVIGGICLVKRDLMA